LLLAAAVLFLAVLVLFWIPLPIKPSPLLRIVSLFFGSAVYFSGLGLYVWGMHILGYLFAASTGMGAHLYADHRLITSGPFTIVRHPMYLALQAAALGMIFLFQTWSCVLFLLFMLSLYRRARMEERALALEFGAAWEEYCRRVPPWFPRITN
jgi:protein-S-isoprenylcysteine O-methyltransferase Ste14